MRISKWRATARDEDGHACSIRGPRSHRCNDFGAARCGSIHPILNLQPLNASKLAFVVGDQSESGRLGVRRNPQVVVADHLAFELQRSSDFSVRLAGARWELHDWQQAGQLLQLLDGSLAELALLRSVDKLAIGDD
jgi:hypothetical protein